MYDVASGAVELLPIGADVPALADVESPSLSVAAGG
jgi:hypothetical protein